MQRERCVRTGEEELRLATRDRAREQIDLSV